MRILPRSLPRSCLALASSPSMTDPSLGNVYYLSRFSCRVEHTLGASCSVIGRFGPPGQGFPSLSLTSATSATSAGSIRRWLIAALRHDRRTAQHVSAEPPPFLWVCTYNWQGVNVPSICSKNSHECERLQGSHRSQGSFPRTTGLKRHRNSHCAVQPIRIWHQSRSGKVSSRLDTPGPLEKGAAHRN